ncbi:MAG: glutamate--cysteine ligase [Thermodesulfobacteriota bacterium]
MTIEFKKSEGVTLGIEAEIQLVHRDTLALMNNSTDIIDSLSGLDSSVKHELLMSNLEINTCICSSVAEAERDLREKFAVVSKAAEAYDTLLCCAGTHPFSRWRDQVVTEDERYMRLMERLKIITRRFNIFGLHVHVGLEGGEKCIYVMNRMLFYLPHLLALSANSPFWQGDDTGLKSYRVKVFENLPVAGLPFYFDDWADFSRLIDNYKATGTIETIREIWWDIRPHPDFGTVEIRVCDMPGTIKETLAIAALIQALVKKFGDEYERGVPFERPHSAITRENKWRAARYGLDGEFLTEDGGSTVPVREAIGALLGSVEEEAATLGSAGYLSALGEILAGGTGADRQLRVFKEGGDLKGVVRDMTDGLLAETRPADEGE